MNGLVAWIAMQLASPTTHTVLMVAANTLTQDGILPPPWGFAAQAIFGALGIGLPEAGEKK